MDLFGVALGVFVILFVLLINRLRQKPAPPRGPVPAPQIGDITAESLQAYCGYDYMKPVLLAVQGVVYDVTDQAATLYGPGKPQHALAGKEVARALALDSTDPKDLGSSSLTDLGETELSRLKAKLAELVQNGAQRVGQVVPMKEMTLEQLARHDGSVPDLPLLLSIQGTIYNIEKGRAFYGPDGVYPFAGKECARALALMSTELSDCNDDLEGLSYTEQETLREWKGKFNFKYPIVGRLVKAQGG